MTTTTAPTLTAGETDAAARIRHAARWGEIVTECRSCGVVTVRQA